MAKKKTTRKTKSTSKKTIKKATKKATKSVAKDTVKTEAPVTDFADQLWEELRSKPINMFALPNQKVEDHVTRVKGVPGALCVTMKSPAALPALEEVLNSHEQTVVERTEVGDPVEVQYPLYEMQENEGGYVLIKRYLPPHKRPELQPK